MDDKIEDLFIVKEDFGKENAKDQAKRALIFGRVAQDGTVVIDNRNLSKIDQLKLCLVIRHIANCLNENIDKEIRPVELTSILGQRFEAIGSSLSKLATEGFAKKVGHGKYSVFPYKIDSFLDYLESLNSQTDAGAKKTRRGSGKRGGEKGKPIAFSKIGKHIQQLVDNGFFQNPRFISEVVDELKKETIFRDPKVIDKTIRDSFVSTRKTLQRIKNEGGGRATWKYVIRK